MMEQTQIKYVFITEDHTEQQYNLCSFSLTSVKVDSSLTPISFLINYR